MTLQSAFSICQKMSVHLVHLPSNCTKNGHLPLQLTNATIAQTKSQTTFSIFLYSFLSCLHYNSITTIFKTANKFDIVLEYECYFFILNMIIFMTSNTAVVKNFSCLVYLSCASMQVVAHGVSDLNTLEQLSSQPKRLDT